MVLLQREPLSRLQPFGHESHTAALTGNTRVAEDSSDLDHPPVVIDVVALHVCGRSIWNAPIFCTKGYESTVCVTGNDLCSPPSFPMAWAIARLRLKPASSDCVRNLRVAN